MVLVSQRMDTEVARVRRELIKRQTAGSRGPYDSVEGVLVAGQRGCRQPEGDVEKGKRHSEAPSCILGSRSENETQWIAISLTLEGH